MFFNSLDSILKALTRTLTRLEAHVERKCEAADSAKAKAAAKRIEADNLDTKASKHMDEAARTARIASRIHSLLN
jgi:hypothetical protein